MNNSENNEVQVDPDVIAGMIRENYDSGQKLAAETIKKFLENVLNSREEAIKLCNDIIEDAENEIKAIHKKLGIE